MGKEGRGLRTEKNKDRAVVLSSTLAAATLGALGVPEAITGTELPNTYEAVMSGIAGPFIGLFIISIRDLRKSLEQK